MTIVKGQMKFLDENGNVNIRHPETSASIVRMNGLSSIRESSNVIDDNDSVLTAIAKLNSNINSIIQNCTFPNYAECDTSADIQIKHIYIENIAIVKGTRISVLFNHSNTADNPKLSVNTSEAKDIYYRGFPLPKDAIQENSLLDLIFNGNHWNIVGSIIWTS